jgi:hypothetical protein
MALEDLFQKEFRGGVRRIKPSNGLMITSEIWGEAHDYHRSHERLHALSLHRPGIPIGLEVVAHDPPDRSVIIHPGVAIDPLGQVIVVPERVRFDITIEEAGLVFLYAEFRELDREPLPFPDGIERPTRLLETYLVQNSTQLTPYAVELARLQQGQTVAPLRDALNPQRPRENEIDLRFRLQAGTGRRGRIVIGEYRPANAAGDEWHRAIEGLESLAQEIRRSTDYDAEVLTPAGPDAVRACTLLYVTGARAAEWTSQDQQALVSYLDYDGVILVEDGGDGSFLRSFQGLGALGISRYRPVPRPHPLMTMHYRFAVAPGGGLQGGRREEGGEVLCSQGRQGGVALLGSAWEGGSEQQPLSREDIRAALEFGVNLALYAYQRKHTLELRRAGLA